MCRSTKSKRRPRRRSGCAPVWDEPVGHPDGRALGQSPQLVAVAVPAASTAGMKTTAAPALEAGTALHPAGIHARTGHVMRRVAAGITAAAVSAAGKVHATSGSARDRRRPATASRRGLTAAAGRPRRRARASGLSVTTDHLTEVLGLHKPVALHLLEDASPAFPAFHGGDLIQSPRLCAAGRVLRIEQRLRNPLAAGRKVLERTR